MELLPAGNLKPLRVYSDGAGTQSIATMVLQAQGKLPKPYDYFVFANVGDDSENPDTLEYRQEWIIPFAKEHGINLVERQKLYKGKPQTLLEAINADNKTIPIPVYFGSGGKGNRKCTVDWKVAVVNRWVTMEAKPSHVEMGIGFSMDEGGRIWQKFQGWHDHNFQRNAKTRQWKKGKKLGFWRKYEYPLAQLKLTKADCIKLVMDFGFPEPPPSLCTYCPFLPLGVHIARRNSNDPKFEQTAQIEDRVNEKYATLNRIHRNPSNAVYLTPTRVPLRELPQQLGLWDEYAHQDEQCTEGVCGF